MKSNTLAAAILLGLCAVQPVQAQTGTPRNVAIRQSYLKAMCKVPTLAEISFWESQNVTPANSKDEAPYIAAHRNFMRDNPSVKADVVRYSYAFASYGRYKPTPAEVEHWGQRLVNGPETCPDAVVMHRKFLNITTPVPYDKPGFPPGTAFLSCTADEARANGDRCPIPRR